ncbi:MAG: pentapeptide repeat-containing protein [Amphritea sp.]|nr:pentapeptide repeat-containing protein [Amphritea sp.]
MMEKDNPIDILHQGVDAWNEWRLQNQGQSLQLPNENLQGLFQTGLAIKGFTAPLSGVNFSNMNLRGAFIESADLSYANFSGADLSEAILNGADMSHADLSDTTMVDTNLKGAMLDNANLQGANLMRSTLVQTSLQGADLRGCNIYGVSVWGVKIDEHTNQSNLLIQNYNEPLIRVPSLEMAQLIYLLLDDRTKLRELLCGIGERGVLILGRFEPKRKDILDAVADVLTTTGYLPIMFDFDEIPGRNYTETIVLLAGMSKFIIADLTEAKSLPQEAQAITSQIDIPFMSIIEQGHDAWSMMKDIVQNRYVDSRIISYQSKEMLVARVPLLVEIAEQNVEIMRQEKAQSELTQVSIEEI